MARVWGLNGPRQVGGDRRVAGANPGRDLVPIFNTPGSRKNPTGANAVSGFPRLGISILRRVPYPMPGKPPTCPI